MKKLLFIFLLVTFSFCILANENQSITVKDLFFMKKEETIRDNNLVMAHNIEQSEQDNYTKQQEQLYSEFLEAVQTKEKIESRINMILSLFIIVSLSYCFYGIFLERFALFPISQFFFDEKKGSVEYFKIKNRIITETQANNDELNGISFNSYNQIVFNDQTLWEFNHTEALVLKSIYDEKMKEFKAINDSIEKEKYESLLNQL